MKIIISPAKKMQCQSDIMEADGIPVFLEDARRLKDILSGCTQDELKSLFQANDDITKLNYQRFRDMDLDHNLTPAVLAYIGLQFQAMAPFVFTTLQWDYIKEHLRILSGFYGILRACDPITPYRLEMQAKLRTDNCKDLYEYWGSRIYRELVKDDRVILNLASKEYSKAVTPYLEADTRMIDVVFGEFINGKVKVKATEAKKARGTMVRWLAENQIKEIGNVCHFSECGFHYQEEMSDETHYIFIKGSNDRN